MVYDGNHSESGGSRIPNTIRRDRVFVREQEEQSEIHGPGLELLEATIDHGCFALKRLSEMQTESQYRDVMVLALLRRILITAEAVRTLATNRLVDPAMATRRTLLDLEVSLRLVVADDSDDRARYLYLSHAVRARRSAQASMQHTGTRELIQANPRFWDWFKGMSRSAKRRLDAEQSEYAPQGHAQHWLGVTQQEAFEMVDMQSDYDLEYIGLSNKIHGGDLQPNIVRHDECAWSVQELTAGWPSAALSQFGPVTCQLLDIYELVLDDREWPDYHEGVIVLLPDGRKDHVTPVMALKRLAVQLYRDVAVSHQ